MKLGTGKAVFNGWCLETLDDEINICMEEAYQEVIKFAAFIVRDGTIKPFNAAMLISRRFPGYTRNKIIKDIKTRNNYENT